MRYAALSVGEGRLQVDKMDKLGSYLWFCDISVGPRSVRAKDPSRFCKESLSIFSLSQNCHGTSPMATRLRPRWLEEFLEGVVSIVALETNHGWFPVILHQLFRESLEQFLILNVKSHLSSNMIRPNTKPWFCGGIQYEEEGTAVSAFIFRIGCTEHLQETSILGDETLVWTVIFPSTSKLKVMFVDETPIHSSQISWCDGLVVPDKTKPLVAKKHRIISRQVCRTWAPGLGVLRRNWSLLTR